MEIKLNIKNITNLPMEPDLPRLTEIFEALLVSGGLTGVKGGKTIIHFDSDGIFQRVQLDYYPWVKRKP
jgi:hypothetical protein